MGTSIASKTAQKVVHMCFADNWESIRFRGGSREVHALHVAGGGQCSAREIRGMSILVVPSLRVAHVFLPPYFGFIPFIFPCLADLGSVLQAYASDEVVNLIV